MEKNDLSISYRGFTITHREIHGADHFHIEGDTYNNDKPTLLKTMESIDRILKTKFEKADVIIPHWGYGKDKGEIREATLTSITEDGNVWVSYKQKTGFRSREKMGANVLFDTPENREIIDAIFAIMEEKRKHDEKIEQEIKALKMQMSSPIPTKNRKESEE